MKSHSPSCVGLRWQGDQEKQNQRSVTRNQCALLTWPVALTRPEQQWPAVKNTPMKDKIEHVVVLVSLELYNLALGWICVNLTMYTNESSCGKNNLRKHNSTLPPMLGVQLDADHNLPFCPFWSHAGVAFDNGLLFTEGQAWHSAAWQRIVAKLYQGHNSSGWAVTETPFWSLLLLGV